MPDLLLYGDTQRNAALRHEIPIPIGDPFLFGEVGSRTFIMASSLERERVARARPDAELLDVEELGFHELIDSGMTFDDLWLELTSRAAARTGVVRAIVDLGFPVGVADRLRADGIELTVDEPAVSRRRRVKSEGELAGIRRAQKAAEAGMAAGAALLRRAEPRGGRLFVDGEPLLAETVRAAMQDECWRHGALLGSEAIVASVWQGTGHEPGSGALPAGLPIEIDLWPQDEASACWADMTRTFVIGDYPEEVSELARLVREATEAARVAVRPGMLGRELHALACDVFEREGYRTQRTGPGEDRNEGFQFSLGHGVGLEVHEAPSLGLPGHQPLVAGDVVAIEPGLWRSDLGGVRLEDLLLVTDDGCETLTDYSYSLTP